MSAVLAVVRTIGCDGPALGLRCAVKPYVSEDTLFVMRAALRRRGWTRRVHGDVQVDLCPRCSRRATLTPGKGGRPRKVRAVG